MVANPILASEQILASQVANEMAVSLRSGAQDHPTHAQSDVTLVTVVRYYQFQNIPPSSELLCAVASCIPDAHCNQVLTYVNT